MHAKHLIVFLTVQILLITASCGGGGKPASQTATQPPVATSVQPAVPPTLEPTLEPTLPPTPTDTPVPAGPCTNVFYPFVPGYQWIYKLDDGNDQTEDFTRIGLTVSSAEGSQVQVDALDISTGVVTHTTVECADGAIKNYPLFTLGTLLGDIVNGEMKVVYVSGIFVPAENALAAANWNTTWTGSYKASGTFTVVEESEPTTLTLQDSPVQMDWSLVGREPVTVEAGTFEDAYKVTRKATIDVNVSLEAMTVQAKLIVNTTQWYASGIGPLKSVVDSASLGYMGINFPVQVNNRMELVEFRPGG